MRHAVVEVKEHHDAEGKSGDGLDDEEPLPSSDSSAVGEVVQDIARKRSADYARDWISGHEERHHLRSPVGREPVGEIEHHTGEKASLSETQKKAARIELPGCMHKGCAARHDTPGNEYATQPNARSHPVKDQITRYLEYEVSDKKHAGTQTVNTVGELEVTHHLQLGEAHVDSIKVRHDVANQENRDDTPRDPGVERIFPGGV